MSVNVGTLYVPYGELRYVKVESGQAAVVKGDGEMFTLNVMDKDLEAVRQSFCVAVNRGFAIGFGLNSEGTFGVLMLHGVLNCSRDDDNKVTVFFQSGFQIGFPEKDSAGVESCVEIFRRRSQELENGVEGEAKGWTWSRVAEVMFYAMFLAAMIYVLVVT